MYERKVSPAFRTEFLSNFVYINFILQRTNTDNDTENIKHSRARYVGHYSSVVIGTRYGMVGPVSNPHGKEIFRTRPDQLWGKSSLLQNGYRVIPGAKSSWAWRYHQHPSSAEVKERVELYLYIPSGPS